MALLGGGLCTPDNLIKTPSDLFSFSHIRNATRLEDNRLGALRTVSSSREGVQATVGEQVEKWQNTPLGQDERNTERSFNDPELDAGVGPHPRIGIGLPMSNIFSTCVILLAARLITESRLDILEDHWSWCLWMDGVR